MYIRWHECELCSGFTHYIIEHYRLSDMEILHTETNRGKKAIIVDGDIVYVCSINKKCNKSITIDPDARQPG